MQGKQETRLKKAHIALMKHPQTALYSGVMLMGKSEVIDGEGTAYTNGVDKRYYRKFIQEHIKSESSLRGLVLHENLHVALKQIPRGREMFKENRKLANIASDLVVNDIIVNIKGTVSGGTEPIVSLPTDDAVYDPMFHNWSMREIYNYLKPLVGKKPPPPQGGKGDGQGSGSSQGGEQNSDTPQGEGQDSDDGWKNTITINGKTYDLSNSDEHDTSGMDGLDHDDLKKINDSIDKALREGGMLAGRMGGKMPRAITDMLAPEVDWRHELREFVSSSTRGNDEFTWRRMNKRHMANDIYLPSVENETIGEVVVAIDTSGSIGDKELSEFAKQLASICELVEPELVRVIWWDYDVHGEQVFTDNYANIGAMLKPLGGGGTRVTSVNNYINEKKITADCVLIFTDGYVESDITWTISSPTLWFVTQAKGFVAPNGGKVVEVNDE